MAQSILCECLVRVLHKGKQYEPGDKLELLESVARPMLDAAHLKKAAPAAEPKPEAPAEPAKRGRGRPKKQKPEALSEAPDSGEPSNEAPKEPEKGE